MNNEPLVTAIITTYRRDKSIVSRAINSVLMQTYKNIELIVVDDNGIDSEYHTMVYDVVNSYKSDKIRLIANKNNSGVQVSRNLGIKNANGEYLALLDDDDEWLPTKIEEQINIFSSSDESLGIVYSWYFRVDVDENQSEKISTIMLPSYDSEHVTSELIRYNFIGSNSFPMLRTSYVRDVGGYDENLPSNQDLDLWIRLSMISNVYCIEKPLSKYYEHTGERITNNYIKKIDGKLKFYKKYKKIIDNDTKSYQVLFTDIASYLIKESKYIESREALESIYKKCKITDLTVRSIGLYIKSYLVQWGLLSA